MDTNHDENDRYAAPEGWEFWHTGGGCTAWKMPLPAEHPLFLRAHHAVPGYLMLTDCDAGAPDRWDTIAPVSLGVYLDDGDGMTTYSCEGWGRDFRTLPDALVWVEDTLPLAIRVAVEGGPHNIPAETIRSPYAGEEDLVEWLRAGIAEISSRVTITPALSRALAPVAAAAEDLRKATSALLEAWWLAEKMAEDTPHPDGGDLRKAVSDFLSEEFPYQMSLEEVSAEVLVWVEHVATWRDRFPTR